MTDKEKTANLIKNDDTEIVIIEEPAIPLSDNEDEEFESQTLETGFAPHIHGTDTKRGLMLDFCIALIPVLIWGIMLFGWRALILTLVSVIFSVGSEFLYKKLMKEPVSVFDFSTVLTGMLLALNLSIAVPLWLVALGAVFAVVAVKWLLGGKLHVFLNPVLAARLVMSFFNKYMNTYTVPKADISLFAPFVDSASGATPLASLKSGIIPESPSLFDAIIGYEAGCIGEVSALLLTVGFIYLLVRKALSWHIPVSYIGTVLVLAFSFSRSIQPFDFALYEIFSGGLFMGAVFMATDYMTSPITSTGKLIYGVGCGVLTVVFRFFGISTEGVCLAVLIMNLTSRYLDIYLRPAAFGIFKKKQINLKLVEGFIKGINKADTKPETAVCTEDSDKPKAEAEPEAEINAETKIEAEPEVIDEPSKESTPAKQNSKANKKSSYTKKSGKKSKSKKKRK